MLTIYAAICIGIAIYPPVLTMHHLYIYSVNVDILAFNRSTLEDLHDNVHKHKREPLTFIKRPLCKFQWGGHFLQCKLSFNICRLVFTECCIKSCLKIVKYILCTQTQTSKEYWKYKLHRNVFSSLIHTRCSRMWVVMALDDP